MLGLLWLAIGTTQILPPPAEAERSPLRLLVERTTAQGDETAVIYGDGVAFWRDRLQFRVPPEGVARLVETLEAAKFQEMPDHFGDGKKWLRGRISLTTASGAKQVVQLVNGEQSNAFAKLGDQLFAIIKPLASSGVSVASLSEGLRKLASGELAPQSLSLTFLLKPPGPTVGFLLQIQDGRAVSQAYRNGGFEPAQELRLAPGSLREWAATLGSGDLETLPGNLYATEYTELVVKVLDRSKSILARQFSGMTPTTKGEPQARFDRLMAALTALRTRTLQP